MIRVLVIDDSARSRASITAMLEASPEVRVVARAADGDEGLRRVFEHDPDVITLDLDMPRMDGFTFLRILMSRRPKPVIVLSSHARKENVFRALELGALDFVVKPAAGAELLAKVQLARRLRPLPFAPPPAPRPPAPAPAAPAARRLEKLVLLAGSSGGPPAIQQVLAALDPGLPLAVVVVQHMPARFTTAFAERLDRAVALEVREAQGGDLLRPGLALVAPGARQTRVVRAAGELRTLVEPPREGERFAPSVDVTFASAAAAFGAGVVAVIMTGMAGEGGRAARAVTAAGGTVIVESPDTALISGMPDEAIRAVPGCEIVPLGQIAETLARRI